MSRLYIPVTPLQSTPKQMDAQLNSLTCESSLYCRSSLMQSMLRWTSIVSWSG